MRPAPDEAFAMLDELTQLTLSWRQKYDADYSMLLNVVAASLGSIVSAYPDRPGRRKALDLAIRQVKKAARDSATSAAAHYSPQGSRA